MMTRVSTAADFPNVVVYECPGRSGPSCTITFRNLEMGSEAERLWKIPFMTLFGCVLMLLGLPAVAVAFGEHWAAGAAVMGGVIGAFILMRHVLVPPYRTDRAIELNPDSGTLRVCRNGKVEIERRLTGLANLTVEPHPEAEYRRMLRMEKGEKAISSEEKQHCLFGWFGEGGAEKLLLIPRVEWPSHQSLFEVRQALIWALDRVAAPARQAVAAEEAAEGVGPYKPAGPARPAGGINPPLD